MTFLSLFTQRFIQHPLPVQTLPVAAGVLLTSLLPAPSAWAGLPITDLTTVTVPATPSTYTENGVTYNFGQGVDINIATVGVDTNNDGATDITLSPGTVADRVVVRRIETNTTGNNAAGVMGDRLRLQYEGQRNNTNTVFNIQGSQVNSVEEVLGSLSVNRGTDNLFLNVPDGPSNNANNIERVDLVWFAGITAPNNPALLDDLGFIFNERFGNNPYQIAAITAIDAAGNPTAFGPLVSASVVDYGPPQFLPTPAWQILASDVDSSAANVPEYAFTTITDQGFEGQFHSFQELGVAPGQTVFGYALFASDVTPAMDLLGLSDVPLNTDDGAFFPDTGDHFGGGGAAFVNTTLLDPSLGLAKQVANISGTQVTFDFVIENFGFRLIDNLSLTDNLDNTFGAGNYSIVSDPVVQVPPLSASSTVNVAAPGAFTGSGAGTEMLSLAASQLAPGDRVTIRVVINIDTIVDPDGPGPLGIGEYENTATTSGTDPDNQPVTDQSTDGTDPDNDPVANDGTTPDGGTGSNDDDTDPSNNTSPTPIAIGDPNLILVKRITALSDASGTTNFTNFVNDSANANAVQLAGLDPVGVPEIGPTDPAQSGDIVEYTIYFLSNGLLPANSVRICDLIPAGTVFVSDAYGVGQGIQVQLAGTTTPITQTNGADADNGTFFSPLAPLAADTPCADPANPTGAVVVDLGNVSNAAPNNVGFMRFRVQLN